KKLLEKVSSKDYDSLSEKQLNSFYSTTNHYLYELPLWNAGSGRTWALLNYIVPYLKKKKQHKILDFGGGTGDLSIGLVQKGFDVSYVDLNEPAISFAKWRINRQGLKVNFLDGNQLTGKDFDAIVSFDVFEHLKDLPGKINFLASCLKRGGVLIFNIEFSGDGLHLDENKKYQGISMLDSIVRKSGLTFDKKFKDIFFYIKK
ncbi:MAG: class I SAM-dependent methyltransferase, partial [Candidatus Omnitrophica bacterium]|nr:class I SAM-dependent methyltransferase [Candidatus Omnitrophota bacterium]